MAKRGVKTRTRVAVLDNFLGVAERGLGQGCQLAQGSSDLLIQTDEETASEDDQAAPTCRKQDLKSGKLRIADTEFTKRITWPHELGRIH